MRKTKSKKSKLPLVVAIILIFSFLYVVITIGVYRYNTYSDKFVDNVYVNGVDVSKCTIGQSYERLKERYNKNLVVSDDIANISFNVNDVSTVTCDEKALEDIFLQTNTLDNKFFGTSTLNYVIEEDIEIDKEKLVEKLNTFIYNETRLRGEDAKIVYNDNQFTIQDETHGTIINVDKFVTVVEDYIRNNCANSTDNDFILKCSNEDIYDIPNVVHSDLVDICNNLNQSINSLCFDMNFYGNVEKIDSSVLYSWLTFNEDGSIVYDDNGDFVFDEDKIYDTMVAFSITYFTYGQPIEFTTHNGDVITIDNPSFGWSLKVDDTTDAVVEHLSNKDTSTLNGIFIHEGVENSNGVGTSYIEVDIDEQHMYYYKNGELVFDSDFVSGNYGSNDTNKGIHRLIYKTRNATLRGRGYATPVSYWMPFNSDGEGFHDATWRKSFGGEIYKGDGSHGCVNMPLAKAKELYSIIDDKAIVVVY